MTKTNEDLIREINELKTEMKQMREILNMLFTIVVDSDDDDEEEDYGYPGFTQDTPKFNT
ncbi:hypothetical protein [Methanomassiliicoccus luminyensis]|uniref:hypothetical protein n=1 Tax=Methanomassiliicoccus luminyensis TaxID=1080712 RepID=UPI00036249A4|nr:hypothetical protein [Methanomassiliicoccus luminyensis]